MSDPSDLRLSGERAAAIEAMLRSPCVEAVASLLWRLRRKLGVEIPPCDARDPQSAHAAHEAIDRARELGLAERSPTGALSITPLGATIADSLGEYVLWKQRGRRHHASDEIAVLNDDALRGKRILEIGCGAGVNLFSLQRCAEVVGVDVEPAYLEFTELLARVEGLPSPRRICARAEHLPFEDGSFDVVLFPGSLPYMDVEDALREAARVLRPGGRAIAAFMDLGQVMRDRWRARRWTLLRPGVFAREARGIAGMLLYPWCGRAILKPFAPIHVTRRRTRRWLAEAGLTFDARATTVNAQEVFFVAEKPAASSAHAADGYRAELSRA
jgi:ubiquinone/menaquinone biosynthesis C-methylase UbiE